jgi:hypothetical protein
MSEEAAVSSNQAQEGKYVRKLFTRNAVLEHPEPTNTNQDATAGETTKRSKEMGENSQIPLFEDDLTSNNPNTDQPLEIRKPRPDESFYLTGNTGVRYCVGVQERVGPSEPVSYRYLPVIEPALSAIVADIHLVLFHEADTKSGKCFAFPQVGGKDRLLPKAWRRCEKEVFKEPLQHWVHIGYGEDLGGYQLHLEFRQAKGHIHNPDFDRQLDAALAPHIIDDVDHPLVRRLRANSGHIDDYDAPLEWLKVG